MWIEITLVTSLSLYSLVTSYTEVWIEISSRLYPNPLILVTSYTEVWIEILNPPDVPHFTVESPPIRRCGLKYHQYLQILIYIKVTSYTEVWIEIKEDFTKLENRLKVTSYTEVWIEI